VKSFDGFTFTSRGKHEQEADRGFNSNRSRDLWLLCMQPYLALNNIKKAQAGDSDTVSKYIDYPSVRQSFKDQMNAKMAKELMNQDNDGFAALGAMLASTMVDKMIDGIVTPEGMTLMLKGKT
jgi:hypothetical protein